MDLEKSRIWRYGTLVAAYYKAKGWTLAAPRQISAFDFFRINDYGLHDYLFIKAVYSYGRVVGEKQLEVFHAELFTTKSKYSHKLRFHNFMGVFVTDGFLAEDAVDFILQWNHMTIEGFTPKKIVLEGGIGLLPKHLQKNAAKEVDVDLDTETGWPDEDL